MAGISDDIENLRVNMGDFDHALEEVHPAFGVAEEELAQVIQNGIIHFDKGVDVRFIWQLHGYDTKKHAGDIA
jgi:vesicle-fusing ATPase